MAPGRGLGVAVMVVCVLLSVEGARANVPCDGATATIKDYCFGGPTRDACCFAIELASQDCLCEFKKSKSFPFSEIQFVSRYFHCERQLPDDFCENPEQAKAMKRT